MFPLGLREIFPKVYAIIYITVGDDVSEGIGDGVGDMMSAKALAMMSVTTSVMMSVMMSVMASAMMSAMTSAMVSDCGGLPLLASIRMIAIRGMDATFFHFRHYTHWQELYHGFCPVLKDLRLHRGIW